MRSILVGLLAGAVIREKRRFCVHCCWCLIVDDAVKRVFFLSAVLSLFIIVKPSQPAKRCVFYGKRLVIFILASNFSAIVRNYVHRAGSGLH